MLGLGVCPGQRVSRILSTGIILSCLDHPLCSADGKNRLRMIIRTARPATVSDSNKGVQVLMRNIQNAKKMNFIFSIKGKSLLVKSLFLLFLFASVQTYGQGGFVCENNGQCQNGICTPIVETQAYTCECFTDTLNGVSFQLWGGYLCDSANPYSHYDDSLGILVPNCPNGTGITYQEWLGVIGDGLVPDYCATLPGWYCGADEHMTLSGCTACPEGTTNEAGDTILLGLTSCDAAPPAAQLTDSLAAVSFPTPITGTGVASATIGWTFTINADSTVTHLGIHNWNNGAGFANARQTGIWDSAGTLVASATVPADGVGAELDTSPFGFYYVALVPNIVLTAGEQYTIGVWYNEDNSPGIGLNASITTIPGLNYLGARTSSGVIFEKPTIASSPGGYFGPNLRLLEGVFTDGFENQPH
jgi:hypothetical protein